MRQIDEILEVLGVEKLTGGRMLPSLTVETSYGRDGTPRSFVAAPELIQAAQIMEPELAVQIGAAFLERGALLLAAEQFGADSEHERTIRLSEATRTAPDGSIPDGEFIGPSEEDRT